MTTPMRRSVFFSPLVLLALAALLAGGVARAEDKPSVIRVAVPGVGIGNRPVTGGSATSTAHLRGLLEEEFKKDGIEVKWTFVRAAGPGVNELYANGLADFSPLGDLPSIVGRASGLKTRLLLSGGRHGHNYVAVPSDSNIQRIEDLKGKRVAVFKGTAQQLAANRVFAAHGFKESDVKTINMDTNTSRAALVTKDIDAAFGGPDLLALRDQGAVRILYTTRGRPELGGNGTVVGDEAFIKRYPDITRRVVKVFVQAAKWLADRDSNPNEAFKLWTKSGVQYSNYREDYQGTSIKARHTPLIDPFLVSRYQQSIEEAKSFGLIRKTFRFEEWAEPRFLKEALEELGLTNFWPSEGAPQS